MQDSRRGFLSTCATGAAVAAVPYFHWTQRTLADETKSKNDRVALGLIGSGSIANANIGAAKDWIDIVAIADVDANRAADFNEKHAGGKAAVFEDYRKVLERKDVDVIHVATPDHWHALPAIMAARIMAGSSLRGLSSVTQARSASRAAASRAVRPSESTSDGSAPPLRRSLTVSSAPLPAWLAQADTNAEHSEREGDNGQRTLVSTA
jgi:hypothetical protein